MDCPTTPTTIANANAFRSKNDNIRFISPLTSQLSTLNSQLSPLNYLFTAFTLYPAAFN